MLHFEDRLKQLEDNLYKHHEAVGEIKQALKQIASSSTKNSMMMLSSHSDNSKIVTDMIYNSSCSLMLDYLPNVDVQVIYNLN